MKKPKIFFCWTLNSGTTFYRMMNPAKYMLKSLDIGFSKWRPDFQAVADWEYKMNEPLVQQDLAFLIDNCAMTIAQKFHWYGGLAVQHAQRTKYTSKPFFTELDDHVFALNPDSAASQDYHAGSELEDILREQIINSTGLIVSTDYLRKVYEKLNPNVWIVPNGIDFQIWDNLKRPKKGKKVRIGWAGGGNHTNDLEFIKPAVENIIKKFKNVEFVFLGGCPPSYANLKKVMPIVKWYPINMYPQEIANLGLDIALAPLRDNEFNRGKSNLRWLEYSALKIPTIASNVEPMKCIDDNQTGMLVTEVDEWENAIATLITSEHVRKNIGQNAYEKVKKDFNVEMIAKSYVDKIRLILKGKVNISKEVAVAALSGN